MAQPVAEPLAEAIQLQRARARTEIRALEHDCRSLQRLLPESDAWQGPASAAFRRRLEGLRERLDAAGAALRAAEVLL